MPEEEPSRFLTIAASLRTATSVLGDATSRLGSNMADINLDSFKSVTSNVAEMTTNVTNNFNTMQKSVQEMASIESIKKMQGMASLENLQEGFQAGIGAGIGGLQTGLEGLEGISKTIYDNLAEGKEAITNTEALKAKGNFQLIKTIKNIEYQILIILMYFALAFAINWYWAVGVEQTMSLVKNSQEYLDDPELEKKLMSIRDSLGEYGDLNQLKQGMDGLRDGIIVGIRDGAKIVKDSASVLSDTLQDSANVLSATVQDSASALRDNINLLGSDVDDDDEEDGADNDNS